jgi:uncharacterized membrane protein YfcA
VTRVLGFPASEIAFLVVWIAGAGILVGVLAGLFGIGGGSVIVPVLYEVFRVLDVPEDVRMQLCIGTSIAIIVPTNFMSYLAHKKKGAVIEEVVRAWAWPSLAGVALGSFIAAVAPGTVFKIIFVGFAFFIAARMFTGGERLRFGEGLPSRPLMWGFGFITGLMSSLVGISGGAISNSVITLYGFSMQRAVATSAGVGVPITIAGTIGYMLAGWPRMAELPPLSIGFISFIGVVLMAPVSSYTAKYGVRLAHWMPKRALEIAFACFLTLVATRFLVSLL